MCVCVCVHSGQDRHCASAFLAVYHVVVDVEDLTPELVAFRLSLAGCFHVFSVFLMIKIAVFGCLLYVIVSYS